MSAPFDFLKNELASVTSRLQRISAEIDQLLDSQQSLLRRRDELKKQINQTQCSTSNGGVKQDYDKTDFAWSENLDKKRSSVFKLSTYRPLQLQTMNASMSRKDCILIMPTGGGKSLCYQLPSLVSSGITLVVSPLISLMEDQLHSLHALGINATLISSSTSRETVNSVMKEMTNKQTSLKLLYVTPERIAQSKRFLAKLEKMHDLGLLARVAIDEVHCCSQWGHDFRPDYKKLGLLKRQFPDIPILGLTATATSKVVEDVKKILGLDECLLFRASYNRPNLYYEVKNKADTHEAAMDDISRLIKQRFNHLSGIIYCLSKKECEQVTADLQRRGIRAGCYHADLPASQRTSIHTRWLNNEIEVVVATIAFGMGIDKSDVRFVIHHSLSKSMENFYQESGRAGRDNQTSHCILFFRFADIFRQSCMCVMEATGQQNLYSMVAYCNDATRCRREMIASHFAEAWNSSHCNGMCDHCDTKLSAKTNDVDISGYCQDIQTILDSAANKSQRMTALKLIDAWLGKGASILRVKSINKPAMTRSECEAVLTTLLLEGYVREDFHFTPYTTISYILPGRILTNQKLMMSFAVKDGQTVRGCLPKSPSNCSQPNTTCAKPKLSFHKSTSQSTPAHSSGDNSHVQSSGSVISHHVQSSGSVISHHVQSSGSVISHHAQSSGSVISHHVQSSGSVISHHVQSSGSVISHHVQSSGADLSRKRKAQSKDSKNRKKKKQHAKNSVLMDDDDDLDFGEWGNKRTNSQSCLPSGVRNIEESRKKIENISDDGSPDSEHSSKNDFDVVKKTKKRKVIVMDSNDSDIEVLSSDSG